MVSVTASANPVDVYRYAFAAMASPCEVQVETDDPDLAGRLGQIVEAEALRIEHKYSRYRDDSVLSRINRSGGVPVEVDPETAALLDYAATCFDLSDRRFDVTSGVLRRVWKFDGSDRIPSAQQVEELLPLIGWDLVEWQRPIIILPAGMEIDFGGLGKEYAVDIALQRARQESDAPVLVNFGGDLRVSGPRSDGRRWRVLIEAVEADDPARAWLEIADGALTTSGDARRFLLKDGVRYCHVLDPRTGWPVQDAPRSVTVAAPSCMEAGVTSTLAMLHGTEAERFLEDEHIQAWVIR
jgi:thiamine biosynthesis lipoprotein